jgi:hypothetical protein
MSLGAAMHWGSSVVGTDVGVYNGTESSITKPLGDRISVPSTSSTTSVQSRLQRLFSGQAHVYDYPLTVVLPPFNNTVIEKYFPKSCGVGDGAAHRHSSLIIMEAGSCWAGVDSDHPHNVMISVFSGEMVVMVWPFQTELSDVLAGDVRPKLSADVHSLKGGQQLVLRSGSYSCAVCVKDAVLLKTLWDDPLSPSHFAKVIESLRIRKVDVSK